MLVIRRKSRSGALKQFSGIDDGRVSRALRAGVLQRRWPSAVVSRRTLWNFLRRESSAFLASGGGISSDLFLLVEPVVTQPCRPSPCGPNSQCREVNGQAVCSCVPGYLGSPPNCRPECVTSSECNQNEACSNQKCRNPCPGTCGVGAKCEVINHNPICSCPPRYTGDPFIRCSPIRKHLSGREDLGSDALGSRYIDNERLFLVSTISRHAARSSCEPLSAVSVRSVRRVSGCGRQSLVLVSSRV